MARNPRSETGGPPTGSVPGERLQKVIGRAGICSRRAAEALIREGRVRINGRVVRTLGSRVRIGRDRVEVDGAELRLAPPTYVLLHKPRGVVSTLRDPQGRPTVQQLLPAGMPRLYPVGRLDLNTEGLLIFTTSGDMANRIMHPRYGTEREYAVRVLGEMDEAQRQSLVEVPLRIGAFRADGVTPQSHAGVELHRLLVRGLRFVVLRHRESQWYEPDSDFAHLTILRRARGYNCSTNAGLGIPWRGV